MIYVYISPDFATYENKDTYTFRTILKIGYSKDETLSSRDSNYRTENPGRRLLYTIPEGSRQDESNLHKRFKYFRIYGKEWFRDSEEIHEFFKTHTTKESLRHLSNSVDIKKDNRGMTNLYKNYKHILYRFFIAFDNILGFQDNSVIQYILEVDKKFSDVEKCLLDWVCEVYPDIASSIIYEYEYMTGIEKQYREFIENFNNMTVEIEKLKFLTDFYNEHLGDTKIIREVFSLIPSKYNDYFTILGPDRIRSLSFKEVEIKREIKRLNNNEKVEETVKETIYNTFKVGDRYSKSDIKEMLRDLYKKTNYKIAPKASQLDEYFQIKEVKVREGDKWTNGFEILAKR